MKLNIGFKHRLRTLPLALSCIMGAGLAKLCAFEITILFTLAIITTLLLISNYANDYGDGIKGTDKLRKPRPNGTIRKISKKSMKMPLLY